MTDNTGTEEIQAIKTTEFMKETIKQRPINKKKLIRRLLTSVAMAVVIGLVACITFILLEPVINKKINNTETEEKPLEEIKFVEETAAEEMLPEDMIADEAELTTAEVEQQQVPLNEEQIEQVLSEMEFGIDDYISMHSAISSIAWDSQDFLVELIGVSQDMDWFDNKYQNEHIISGIVIADNGREFLILADTKNLSSYDSLEVKFNDGSNYEAAIKTEDPSTGLAVVAVNKDTMDPETLDKVRIVEMGSSANKRLIGTPVIALGRPLGNASSVCIGNITSIESRIEPVDGSYASICTDIYGSNQGSGFLINPQGQLIGIIDMSYNSSDMRNIVAGFGITDIKKLIENLSNGKQIPYLGIHGMDVTEDVSNSLQIPRGVYIKSMEMDSPLLEAGMQSGDIIANINGTNILTYQELKMMLLSLDEGTALEIRYLRPGTEGYLEKTLSILPGNEEETE